jgi:serine phosphatase RsbU (regulator of sigma subunit)
VEEALRRAYDPDSGADGVYEAEYRVRVEEGAEPQSPIDGYRWIASKGRVTFDSTGRHPLRLLGLLRDITDRKRAEAERTAAAHRKEQIAEAVQRSLLLTPSHDAYPGLVVAPLYQAADQEALIGGDFYDVFAVAEGRIALLVGDAAGKGVEAATYTAEIKFALRAFLRECGGSPGAALTRLNAFLLENARLDAGHQGCLYTVAALAVVDTATNSVTISTAGAEPPLIVRSAARRDGTTEQGGTFGMMLAILPNEAYTEATFLLQPEDLLIMATDGIIEARRIDNDATGDRSGEIFGVERLIAAVRQESLRVGLDALAEIGRGTIQQTLNHAQGHQRDDICLLVARLQGTVNYD